MSGCSPWLQILKYDTKAIFTAATKAQTATDFILAWAGFPSMTTRNCRPRHKMKEKKLYMETAAATLDGWYNPELYPGDPFLVVAKLTKDAVLSYHTALEIHGRAYSVREHLTYSAARPVSPITFRSRVFRGVRFPQALRRVGNENFGVITVDRAGLEVRFACLERIMVDVLDRPDLSGSWEEVWRSLESVEFFDLDKVVVITCSAPPPQRFSGNRLPLTLYT